MKNKGLTNPHDNLDDSDYVKRDNNLEVDDFDTDLQ